MRYGTWNFHGHSHGNLLPAENELDKERYAKRIDVGVDNFDFYPQNLLELMGVKDGE